MMARSVFAIVVVGASSLEITPKVTPSQLSSVTPNPSPAIKPATPPAIHAATRSLHSDDDTIGLCRDLFTRFSRGQELLRRNHGVPVLNQQAVLDMFISYLNVQCRVPAEVTEMLQRMRAGSLMNSAGGTSGGRLQMTQACMNKEPAFFEAVCRNFFRTGPTVHWEVFPSTTKSIEAFVSLLAHEATLRERPIKVLLPSDCHYCWANVASKYEAHPYLQMHQLKIGSDDVHDVRLRDDDFVVAVFTLANTVSGRTTDVAWFEGVMEHVRAQRATPYAFVDAALSGCVVSRDVLDLRADAPIDGVASILDQSIGLVQSGFKDYGLSSMLFLDDGPFECCGSRSAEAGLASQVAGGAHALIKHAPVTSIPESPTLAFLVFAKEYTSFRKQSFSALVERLRVAIPEEVPCELTPLFPLLHVQFSDEKLCAALTTHLVETYSLITIDAEPCVLRLWPTPTNHDVADAIEAWFDDECFDV